MKIEGIVWLINIVDKLASKHHVETYEVEETLTGNAKFRFVEKGKRKGENVYMALGRTEAGRYLTILFIHKPNKEALILSARDMADGERKCMAENKKQILPSFASINELTEFFDTNDMGDYLEAMPEVHFDVNLQKRTHLVAIDEETNDKLKKLAKQQRVSPDTLLKSWIKEKIASY